DGIRDLIVTGVQTCALPIFEPIDPPAPALDEARAREMREELRRGGGLAREETERADRRVGVGVQARPATSARVHPLEPLRRDRRSEERRVGTRVERGWRRGG